MNITKQLKLQLAKLLQQFSETKLKDTEGNEVIFVSDLAIGVGSEVFISDEAGEMIIPSNGDYIGEDETVYTVLDGVVTAITPKVQEEVKEEEVKEEVKEEIKAEETPTIDDIINAISPIIEQAIIKVKEDILAEVDAKLSKISFSKPADLEIKDGDTKPKTKNRAAEILASK